MNMSGYITCTISAHGPTNRPEKYCIRCTTSWTFCCTRAYHVRLRRSDFRYVLYQRPPPLDSQWSSCPIFVGAVCDKAYRLHRIYYNVLRVLYVDLLQTTCGDGAIDGKKSAQSWLYYYILCIITPCVTYLVCQPDFRDRVALCNNRKKIVFVFFPYWF